MTEYFVRPMREEDIDQVARLEREAFPTQVPGTAFRRELSNRLASYLVVCKRRNFTEQGGETASGDKVLGYAGLWFIVDEAHLTSLAVREAYRRRSLGQRLLVAALELALEKQATLMTLEVRVSNTGAQALYEKFGFTRVGVRRGYYTDNHEDAYLMTVEEIDAPKYREKLEASKARVLAG